MKGFQLHPTGRWVVAAIANVCLAIGASGQEFKTPPARTPQRDAMIEAGRLFFFDSRLSQDNTTSCGSCHDPTKGTSDGRVVGIGRIGGRNPQTGDTFPNGIKGNRRTPPILNAALTPDGFQFWDGRRNGLFAQASGPIENPDEMGNQTVRQVANRMNRYAGYRELMQQAFGEPQVTANRMLSCIVAFEEAELVATDTLLARHFAGEQTTLSDSAKRGAEIFEANCTKCHPAPLFTTGKFVNTAVEFIYTDEFDDEGLGKTTGRQQDARAFKIPSLIAVTDRPPYMHNGSLPTLTHVIEHYNRGGELNGHSDPLKSAAITPLGLSGDQKRDLKNCLEEGLPALDLKPIRVPRVEDFPR